MTAFHCIAMYTIYCTLLYCKVLPCCIALYCKQCNAMQSNAINEINVINQSINYKKVSRILTSEFSTYPLWYPNRSVRVRIGISICMRVLKNDLRSYARKETNLSYF